MAKNFKELRAKMSPEARARSEAKAQQMIAEMPLYELRVARDLTQEQLARVLRINQAAVSKMERRADMYLSTLDGIIKAMGGKLDIRAIFPDGEVRINQFRDINRLEHAD
jgi:transcriptional regulator with XRE-family HTH domain